MKNKFKLIVSSVIILLPILFGVILWDALPDQIATHWGVNGEPDAWSSKASAVFLMPAFLLVLHLICIFATSSDKMNRNQSLKLMGLTYWLVPAVSLAVNGLTYATALGKEIDAMLILPIVMGVLFLLIGNYLPKCAQNRTIGIRIKWTLEDEENWNATHRLSGKAWVIGSLIILASVFLPTGLAWCITIGVTFVMALVPIIYSYCFYKSKNGK
jgi:uncharacterized membrane protein